MLSKELKRVTKLVRLRETTLNELKEVGKMHESYSDVIDRILFKKKTGKDIEDDTGEKVEKLI